MRFGCSVGVCGGCRVSALDANQIWVKNYIITGIIPLPLSHFDGFQAVVCDIIITLGPDVYF